MERRFVSVATRRSIALRLTWRIASSQPMSSGIPGLREAAAVAAESAGRCRANVPGSGYTLAPPGERVSLLLLVIRIAQKCRHGGSSRGKVICGVRREPTFVLPVAEHIPSDGEARQAACALRCLSGACSRLGTP